MKKEIFIGSNSDLIVDQIGKELTSIHREIQIRIVKDLSALPQLADGQLVIIDLSVYTTGIIDRIKNFKKEFPHIELIAVTYTNDEQIDQMLMHRGFDQVANREELPSIVLKYLNSQLELSS
ncbi:MAG: hypothetical protein ABJH98_04020 [Reichenbachiella sp.]|uniref:hypothetical protein n=1 Tax=Reichenbachiella sp. TaxID=2184521 RepID=UPI003297B8E4